MNEIDVTQYIQTHFEGVAVQVADDDSYFFYDPPGTTVPDRRFPFATLVTGDRHDTVSNLSRPGVFRLNVGVSKATFRTLFGAQPAPQGDGSSPYDYAAFDQVMPHPVYGSMYWVCILNPSESTFEGVKLLLAEAYEQAVRKQA